MPQHYLCIGSSAAGLATASKLRQLDDSARITVLTAEQEMPYNRCSLSKYLAGERSNDQIRTRTKSFFTENNIDLKLNSPVVALDAQKQSVTTQSGLTFGYDKLFLGMGRSPGKQTVLGAQAQGVFSFYGLDDSNNILMYIRNYGIKHCLIVGAGVTGLEVADALVKKNISIAMVQRSSQLLSHNLDQEGSQFLEALLMSKHVSLYKKVTVQEIQSLQGRVVGVVLSDGSVVKTDMVIFATGSTLNSDFAKEAGIAVEGSGIKTNEYLQTSIENVYAGGDIALVKNLLTQRVEQNSLWSDAAMQGMFAASNMVGIPKVYEGILPVTNTFIFGSGVAFIGDVASFSEYQNLVKKDDKSYHRFLFQDGVLKGFIMIGNVGPIGNLKQAILSKQVVAAAL